MEIGSGLVDVLDAFGERGKIGLFEEETEGELELKLSAESGDDPCGQQGMTAYFEEVRVDADRCPLVVAVVPWPGSQDFLPDGRQALFEVISRGDVFPPLTVLGEGDT